MTDGSREIVRMGLTGRFSRREVVGRLAMPGLTLTPFDSQTWNIADWRQSG